ncbi:hypothetical protein F0562_030469 [Nyssa sinensis]|uniref:Uncharacterized protein n=1 Tax=Nyssa sinensis TaxID=561372 RepID=A0A5J5AZW3_9ASTE|nr:hypothetical protein F0562_030469 [Nyssa sinensis]
MCQSAGEFEPGKELLQVRRVGGGGTVREWGSAAAVSVAVDGAAGDEDVEEGDGGDAQEKEEEGYDEGHDDGLEEQRDEPRV